MHSWNIFPTFTYLFFNCVSKSTLFNLGLYILSIRWTLKAWQSIQIICTPPPPWHNPFTSRLLSTSSHLSPSPWEALRYSFPSPLAFVLTRIPYMCHISLSSNLLLITSTIAVRSQPVQPKSPYNHCVHCSLPPPPLHCAAVAAELSLTHGL